MSSFNAVTHDSGAFRYFYLYCFLYKRIWVVFFFSSLLPCSIVPIPSSNEEIRLIDDSFGKICHMVSDGSWVVRVQAAKLLVGFFDWRFSEESPACTEYLFCNRFVFVSSGLHEAGEPTLPGADAGQEADVRPQGMGMFTVLPCHHFFLC